LDKQTLYHRPNDKGMAEAGPARKKREKKVRKPDVATISFVRETSYAGHLRIYTLSAHTSRLAPIARTGAMIARRFTAGTAIDGNVPKRTTAICGCSPRTLIFMMDLRDLRALTPCGWEVAAICKNERKDGHQTGETVRWRSVRYGRRRRRTAPM
jgi:hypothetical protein